MKPKRMSRKYSSHKWTLSDTERRLDIICLGCNTLEEVLERYAYLASVSRIKTAWYRGRLGKLMRTNDEIAFGVIHNEWVREYERVGTVMSKRIEKV
jgi:hypothetical protein